jgi:NADH:ubiquinone oxidoreductase subunit F (NADH-binding)
MSQSLWRLLLTCMLLIALPLKGIAAVSQMPCGPGHGNADTVASVHVDAKSFDADHDEAAGQNSGQSAVVVLDHDHDHDHDLAIGHHHDAKLKCGNCAPCCLSLAPSGSVCMVPTVRVGLGEFESLQTRYISADLGGALRPPQAHLA